MKKSLCVLAVSATAAASLLMAGPASADWSVDPATGTGFVGKGDVQSAFGWNDHDLQANHAGVGFSLSGTSTSTTTWTCRNDRNGKDQQRVHLATATTTGTLSHETRINPQRKVTGFLLTGLSQGAVVEEETEGPKAGSCPQGPWALVAGSVATATEAGTVTLTVTYGGESRVLVPETE